MRRCLDPASIVISTPPSRPRRDMGTHTCSPTPCQAIAVGEGAGDRGGPAGDLQQAVDVFQVGAHGSLGYAQAAGDLGVGVPGGDQVQQFPAAGR